MSKINPRMHTRGSPRALRLAWVCQISRRVFRYNALSKKGGFIATWKLFIELKIEGVQKVNERLRFELCSFHSASQTPWLCRGSGSSACWRCLPMGERSMDASRTRAKGPAKPMSPQIVPRALLELGQSTDATAMAFFPYGASSMLRSWLAWSRDTKIMVVRVMLS